MAIGLKHLDNHHGTSFYRNEKNVLFITYKLKKNMPIHEIYESIHQYFWFDKTSKAGNHDKISGQVVHPPMSEKISENDNEEEANCARSDSYTGNLDDTKEIKIDGCNYEMSESEIIVWMEQYGEIKSELEEITISGKNSAAPVGTGSYTLKVRLNRLIPNVLPMQGLKIKCSYQGVKKQCSNCYGYHKPGGKNSNSNKLFRCKKTTFEEYIEIFKVDNPGVPPRMMGITLEDESTWDEENIEEDENEGENTNETDNENTYFNYMYSYDFMPEWIVDPKELQTDN